MPEVIAGNADQRPLFVAVYGGLCGFYIVGGAGLYLDEAQDIFFPANQVDFSARIRRAKIPGDHHVPLLSQMEIGVLLTATPNAVALEGLFVSERVLGEPVENFKHSASEMTGRHGGHAEGSCLSCR